MDKKELFNEMIQGVLHSKNLMLDLDIKLVADSDVICLEFEGQRVRFIYVPYSFNNVDLNKRDRIKIAKEFVNSVTFKELQEMATNKRNEVEQKEIAEENNKHKLEELLKELKLNQFFKVSYKKYNRHSKDIEKITKDEIKVKRYVNGYGIEFKADIDDYSSATIQIRNNKNYTDISCRVINNTIEEIEGIEAIKKVIAGMLKTQDKYHEETKKKIEMYRKEEQRLLEIRKMYLDATKNDNAIIVKYNSTMQVFRAYQKYSIGKGKSGKFYKSDLDDFIKVIYSKKEQNKVQYVMMHEDAVKSNCTTKDYNFINMF